MAILINRPIAMLEYTVYVHTHVRTRVPIAVYIAQYGHIAI